MPAPGEGSRDGASVTSIGSTAVNFEPWPYWLATVKSPPIIWQNLRLIAKPSPVPPNFLVVDASAWLKVWNNLPICSAVKPIPVSVTAKARVGARTSRASRAAERTRSVIVPFSVNLAALDSRL